MDKMRHHSVCLGPNQDYYLAVFRALDQGRGVQINWAAGIFGLLWFWYRKMFWLGTLFFMAVLVAAYALHLTWWWSLAAAHLGSWLLGNNIYYYYINTQVKKHIQDQGEEQAIVSLGSQEPVAGTTATAAITFLVTSMFVGLWLLWQ